MAGKSFVDLKTIETNMHNVPEKVYTTRIGDFRLFGLEGVELRQWRNFLNDNEGSDYNDVAIMMWGCRDKEGKRFLNKETLLQLVTLGTDILEPVVKEIYKLSGLGANADAEIAKNLESRVNVLESEFARIIDAARLSLKNDSADTN